MIQKTTRRRNWSDLDLDFIAHPTTGDVVKKTGVDAIKRSIRNLVLTNFYDRKFRSHIGSNAQAILFDNVNILTATFLKDAIAEVIRNFEPRAQVVQDGILVQVDADGNGYNARISFVEINSGQLATINMFLERLR